MRRSCAVRKSSSEVSTFLNKRAFSIASADCAAKVFIRSTVFCGKAPGVRRRTTSMPTIGNVRFRTMELHASVFDFVVRQSFLQRGFSIALQGGVDGRMHRVGLGGEA